MSKLITGLDAREAVIKGALTLAKAVECTLGPKGKNVVLYEDDKAYITKDGISIAKKVIGENPYEEAGIQILRQASLKTAEEAGDGTTTSIVLAKALLLELTDKKTCYNLPEVFRGMNMALSNFKSILPYHIKTIGYDYEPLKYIATTSTNNDEVLGELVAKAFKLAGPNGCVILDKELHDFTSLEETKGIQLNKGCYDPIFFTDRIKGIAEYNNCNIIFYKGKLEKITDLEPVSSRNYPSPYIVIATDFSSTVINTMIKNTIHGNIRFLPIVAEGMAESKLKCVEDLIAATGSTNAYGDRIVVGKIKSITASIENTIIEIDSSTDRKLLQNLINEYNYKIKNYPENAEYFQKRLAKLTGSLIIIKAGGATEVEAKEIKDRIEDAICAVRASIEEGIADGGGSTYYRIANVMTSGAYKPAENGEFLKGYDAVVKAMHQPIIKLCENANLESSTIIKGINDTIGYNFNTNSYEDLSLTGVQDPAKVIKLAITNAISVVQALMTIECIIPNNN